MLRLIYPSEFTSGEKIKEDEREADWMIERRIG